MADLDDFFKKKDTKRSKGTKKTTSKSEIKVKKQEKPIVSLLKDNDLFSNADDGWKDIEEESKKDYSGLKIQNLQLNDVDSNDKVNSKQESDEETEINEQGETVKKSTGPWKKVEIPEPDQKEVEDIAPPVVEKKQEESVYVPPSLRIKNKIAVKPIKKSGNNDLSCKESFPELGMRK